MTQFSWVSPMYAVRIHVIKLVFVLLTCLLLKRGLSQELRRVERKLLVLPYTLSQPLSQSGLGLHLLSADITEGEKRTI